MSEATFCIPRNSDVYVAANGDAVMMEITNEDESEEIYMKVNVDDKTTDDCIVTFSIPSVVTASFDAKTIKVLAEQMLKWVDEKV